ncbi:MAG TPA: glycoside hydrolase family 43 protein [Opitutaceae bacterium]|nr:glycoside hydrolase family 43 protein [Opitutaceae bacterium]
MKHLLPTLTLTLTLTLTSAAFAADPVRFGSFEYTGRDAIFAQPLPEGHFRNPILAGYYPDPSICRVGDDYYLINSTFAHFPGIPIFHSRDLVNWKQIGHAIDRPGQLPYDGLGITRGIFAPAISHHDGLFYIVCTMVDAGGNFFLTASDPAGPWSDPVWLEFDGIDPSIFFDESTGRAWIVNNGEPPDRKPLYQGHRAIWIQEWDIAARRPTGPRKIIINGGVDLAAKPVWIEGPHIYKRGDWYYLNCAEGGTSEEHSQVIFRSKSPDGPYVPFAAHPTLTQRDLDPARAHPVTCTGHADFEIGPDGNWWSVFLGCTPYSGGHYNTGRQTFLLPVTWSDDDWPQILPPGEPVPFVAPSPAGASVDTSLPPLTGNFTWRDDFSAPTLGQKWIFLRAPHEQWWSTGDGLKIVPRAESLAGKGNPSFVGRRLQHNRFTTSTALTLPGAHNVSAGLVAFHNETHHFVLGARRNDGSGYTVFVESKKGADAASQAAAVQIDAAPGETLHLRLRGDDTDYIFDCSTDGGASWTQVGGTFDARQLSVATSYDFIGVLVGVIARKE